MLKTPEGFANKPYRKKLSIAIVFYLLRQWVARKLMPRMWLDMFTQTKKRDDLADVFLMTYVEELKRRKHRLAWETLNRLFANLISEEPFCPGGKCPLELSAEGTKRCEAYVRKLKRLELKARIDASAAKVRGKRKNAERDAADPKQRRITFDAKSSDAITPSGSPHIKAPPAPMPSESLAACAMAAERHKEQAVMRKTRGALNDAKRIPDLHATERQQVSAVRTVHLVEHSDGTVLLVENDEPSPPPSPSPSDESDEEVDTFVVA
jgi:hypothetical protein